MSEVCQLATNSKAERSKTFNERIGRVGVGESSEMSFGKLMR